MLIGQTSVSTSVRVLAFLARRLAPSQALDFSGIQNNGIENFNTLESDLPGPRVPSTPSVG